MGKEIIRPAKTIAGGLEPPGDKSISHRYAMLAALANGTSELRHFSSAADCESTLDCLRALGAEVKRDKETVRITGRGARGLKSSWRMLDAGNSGTTMRLLAGILAGQKFSSKITGDVSLRQRPMKRVVGGWQIVRPGGKRVWRRGIGAHSGGCQRSAGSTTRRRSCARA